MRIGISNLPPQQQQVTAVRTTGKVAHSKYEYIFARNPSKLPALVVTRCFARLLEFVHAVFTNMYMPTGRCCKTYTQHVYVCLIITTLFATDSKCWFIANRQNDKTKLSIYDFYTNQLLRSDLQFHWNTLSSNPSYNCNSIYMHKSYCNRTLTINCLSKKTICAFPARSCSMCFCVCRMDYPK